MSDAIRVIIANSDEGAAAELRAFLLGIENVKIAAEVDEPAMLEHALKQFPAEVLLLPGLARDAATMWTHRRFAAVSWKATGRVLPVIHPAAWLSPMNRSVFRPPAGYYAIELPGK